MAAPVAPIVPVQEDVFGRREGVFLEGREEQDAIGRVQQVAVERGHSSTPTVFIVTAGLSRSGKSTALNNAFGANFKNYYSTSSVTRSVEMRRSRGDYGMLVVVDTPGFGATDLSIKEVRKEFLDAVGSLSCVLVYCYSISPSSPQSVADELVVKNLQEVLGRDVWKRCVVLFTFSDQVRAQVCPEPEDRELYKGFIQGHARRLSEMLKKACGSHVPDVKSIFEVDVDQEDMDEIVAVPVGLKVKEGKEKHELIPDVEGANWSDIALAEIVRKANREDREAYLHHVHCKLSMVGSATGIGIGTAIGAAGGAVLGVATLGFGLAPAIAIGMGVGAFAGGVAGGALGTTGGLSMGEVRYRILASRNKEKVRNAQLISPRPHPPDTPKEPALRPLASERASHFSDTVTMSLPIPVIASKPGHKGSTLGRSASPPYVKAEEPEHTSL